MLHRHNVRGFQKSYLPPIAYVFKKILHFFKISLKNLQGIFPTQGLNPGLLHCRWTLYRLSHQGSPRTTRKFPVTFFFKDNYKHNCSTVTITKKYVLTPECVPSVFPFPGLPPKKCLELIVYIRLQPRSVCMCD